ncbi:MAG: AraC family transcriptional regulator, partial [Ruminococcus sp.]|nr:AraC family transcriptional regulator [Ruminococcus sp.]
EMEFMIYSFYTPATIEVNGKKFEVDYKNSIVLSKGMEHHIYTSECMMLDWIHFSADEHDAQLLRSFNVPFDEVLTIENAGSLTGCVMNLCVICALGTEKYEHELSCILQSVLYSISVLTRHSEESTSIKQKYPEIVQLRRKIYEDPRAEWSMEQMSRMIHASKSQLHKLYKKIYNVSCMEDVMISGMNLAKVLLQSTEMGISEIADRCGFHSYENFFRTFRKISGYAPKEFRENFRTGEAK